MGCVTLEQLADLLEARSSGSERAAVERHLATDCPRCRANWQWLQRLYQLTAADSTPDPPDWLVSRAVAAFAQKHGAPREKGIGKILATLIFDSFHPLQPAEVRNLGEAGRQLIYRAAPYDIDLRFLPSENFRYENVIGQVIGLRPDFSDVAGLPVTVYKGKRKIAAVETNAVGVFNLENLAQGKYDLTIRLQSEEIRIPGAITSGLTD